MVRYFGVALAMLFGLLDFAEAQLVPRVAHSTNWIPFATNDFLVAAAFDSYGNAVVIYDPRAIADYHDRIKVFLLLREEQIAEIAKLTLGDSMVIRDASAKQRLSRPDKVVGSFTVIEEEGLYESPLLAKNSLRNLSPPSKISCLAFRKLNEADQIATLREYRLLTEKGDGFSFGRTRARKPIEFSLDMKKCAARAGEMDEP
ncbi:hypothetical protein SAMN05216359_103185 [Roseateles sp. YR242]|uniref:hypothetical protein n=1 Tax=Roseateles sp. YR242 TaxID=1855305 RepID=UPI0008CB3397|nr:hypothetical protein [Roseateles sp. YR242]SEK81401.1 hypothetical protein SAMN05216359_103185 [Roseateles sp. YR242]